MSTWPLLTHPKVSVVVCNFNYEQYLPAALDSVLKQTYPAFEIIVVDDGSTDGSVDLIKSRYPNLQLFVKKNEGQISAYNKGFEHVNGDVVLFLDSDDELLPDALKVVSNEYIENVVKVQFKMNVIDKDGVDMKSVLPSHLDVGDCGTLLLKSGALYKSPPASGNSYRVDALKRLFPLPTSKDEKHGADYFCIYGISLLGLIASVNQPLFKYRIHESADTIGMSLGFGNAIKKHDRQKVMKRRWDMLREWLVTRLGVEFSLGDDYLDFTQQKFFYAQDVLNAPSLRERFLVFKKHFVWLVKSIFVRTDFNFVKKSGLLIWVFLLIALPQTLAKKVAKKVCNPT